jgi:hypothetical protein
MMDVKLPNTIASSQDLAALLSEIKVYATWFSHESIKQKVAGSRGLQPPELSITANELIRAWGKEKALSRESFDSLVASLERYSKSSPSITFTLAAPPSGELKKTLVSWCRDNIAPNILVTFRFNATILGGMVVQRGSSIFDWSFKRQILNNRQAFPEVLRRV